MEATATPKTYVLLEHMHPKSQNIFIRTGKNQRRLKTTLPSFSPKLKITFIGKDKKTTTIRFKENCDNIYLDKQVKDFGIPANDPFSFSERRSLEFVEGSLTTDDPKVQIYLETYPGFEKFVGKCKDVPRPQYRLHDEQAELEAADQDFSKRLEVANMIAKLDLEGVQNLIIRLIGSHIKKPDTLAKGRKMLVDHMNAPTTDSKELDRMLNKELSIDEEATVLVNKLVNDGLLKFDVREGQVTKKSGQKFINIKSIAAANDEEMQALFVEFIISDAGKGILSDILKLEKVK